MFLCVMLCYFICRFLQPTYTHLQADNDRLIRWLQEQQQQQQQSEIKMDELRLFVKDILLAARDEVCQFECTK